MEARIAYGSSVERPRLTVVKDGGVQGRFSALPHDIIRDTRASAPARLLVAVLQMYGWQGGEITASHATLAADMGCGLKSLRGYLDELIALGIVTERDAGVRRQKVYTLTFNTSKTTHWEPGNTSETTHWEPGNTSETTDCPSSNAQILPVQCVDLDDSNTSKTTHSKKKTPEKKTKEIDLHPTGVDGDASASPATATDQATILRSLSDDARAVLDWHRQCHGSKRPVKLNPTQARQLEEALADLGLDRLKESVEYMAGQGVRELSKAIRAARTKRQRDESPVSQAAPARNGTDRLPPGGTAKQRSWWTDSDVRKRYRVHTNGDRP